ncbi:NUDIX domain-containing protein [Streptomyces griseofuscus]|uniref:NUDIX domain-containing protein n=1 Tax=Streptomyces griseofuscus TaxID=146922 RepID=UPI0036A4C46B
MTHATTEASAAAILTDEEGRVLIVKPTYKPGWNLPGGRIDEGETPRRACARELFEELGVRVTPGRLLAHAFVAPPGRPAAHVYYVFDGGPLTVEQQKEIRLQESELAECRFSFPDDIPIEDIPPAVRPLWSAALAARESEGPAYLELPENG